jgi:hypothetical protein
MEDSILAPVFLTRRFAESFNNGQPFPQAAAIGALSALVQSLLLEVDSEIREAVMASMKREIERNQNRRA